MARGSYYGGSHTHRGQTEPNKRSRDISPAASIRRLEADREKWAEVLNTALEESNGTLQAQCERGLAKVEQSILFYQNRMQATEVAA